MLIERLDRFALAGKAQPGSRQEAVTINVGLVAAIGLRHAILARGTVNQLCQHPRLDTDLVMSTRRSMSRCVIKCLHDSSGGFVDPGVRLLLTCEFEQPVELIHERTGTEFFQDGFDLDIDLADGVREHLGTDLAIAGVVDVAPGNDMGGDHIECCQEDDRIAGRIGGFDAPFSAFTPFPSTDRIGHKDTRGLRRQPDAIAFIGITLVIDTSFSS